MGGHHRARGKILVGTTSWTEKTLITEGHFYPSTLRTAEERLRYYASVFPITEVDSSFYAIPPARNAVLWSERTPAGFVFDLKAYRLFTQHRTPVSSLPSEIRKALPDHDQNVYYDKLPDELRRELWQRFRQGIEPLVTSGRLGVVLFQFAPWLVFGKAGLDHIAHCAQRMEGYRLAVELRNISWLGDKHRAQTLGFLRSLGVAHVIVDEPQTSSFSVPTVWEVTSPEVAVFRLHGRNRVTWQRKGLPSAAERFAYLYDDAELGSFVAPVKRLTGQALEVHVLFNNCHADHAQTNAVRFTELLAARSLRRSGRRPAGAPQAARPRP